MFGDAVGATRSRSPRGPRPRSTAARSRERSASLTASRSRHRRARARSGRLVVDARRPARCTRRSRAVAGVSSMLERRAVGLVHDVGEELVDVRASRARGRRRSRARSRRPSPLSWIERSVRDVAAGDGDRAGRREVSRWPRRRRRRAAARTSAGSDETNVTPQPRRRVRARRRRRRCRRSSAQPPSRNVDRLGCEQPRSVLPAGIRAE